MGKIQFHDYHIAYNSVDLPNVNIFKDQIEVFKEFMVHAVPDEAQSIDIDFLLIIGELFTLVAYGELIIENAGIKSIEDDLLDQIFDFMVRDFSKFALQLYSKTSSTEKQMELCLKMIKKPAVDTDRFMRIWDTYVISEKDAYEMNP